MLYLCSLPNTACGSERRECSEFYERWEPALWAETVTSAIRSANWMPSLYPWGPPRIPLLQ